MFACLLVSAVNLVPLRATGGGGGTPISLEHTQRGPFRCSPVLCDACSSPEDTTALTAWLPRQAAPVDGGLLSVHSTHQDAAIALLPGHADEESWPRFLFLFRGAHGSMRLSELRSAALTLGVDDARLCCRPATVALPRSAEQQPDIASIGGDIGPDLFQWVSLPNAEVAAQVAARCSLVRAAYEVWATAHFSEEPRRRAGALEPAVDVACADERWATLAQCVQADGKR